MSRPSSPLGCSGIGSTPSKRSGELGRHPLYGRVCLPSSPLRFDGVEPMPLQPSGELGRDNRAVYGEWLGLSESEIAQLAREEVI